MGLFSKKDGCLVKRKFQVVNQFSDLKPNEPCNLMLYDDHLKIEAVDRSRFAKLRYEQVRNVSHGSELFDNESSAAGRTLAGSILLGGVGAIAGAASAVKGKVRKQTLVINYTSSAGICNTCVMIEYRSQIHWNTGRDMERK